MSGSGLTIDSAHDGTRLVAVDFGGDGPLALMLHGLAGYGGEWAGTAAWLNATHRVIAPDARGHGESERFPPETSGAAHVADAAGWIETFGRRATVVGHSLGGHTAILLAAARPDLVERLVVADATPEAQPRATVDVQTWFAAWPERFESRDHALAFFGGPSPRAEKWVGGLDDELRSRFDPGVMVATVTELAVRSYWDEWRSIECPLAIVRAAHDGVDVSRMVKLQRSARVFQIDSGHDVHLEDPEAWREVLSAALQLDVRVAT